MPTHFLVLIWAGLGLIAGALALAARLKPANWSKYALLALGLGAALLGGLLGLWLFGRLFSSAAALWIAILALCVPGLYERLRKRLAGHGA